MAIRQIRGEGDHEQHQQHAEHPTRPNCSPTAANGKSAHITGTSRSLVSVALEPSLAPQPARADRPDRVAHLVDGVLELRVGGLLVEEHPQPLDLVLVDEPADERRRRPSPARAGVISAMYFGLAPATSSTPIAIVIDHRGRPEVGLER